MIIRAAQWRHHLCLSGPQVRRLEPFHIARLNAYRSLPAGSEKADRQIALKFAPHYPIALICSSQHAMKETDMAVNAAEVSLFEMDLTETEGVAKTIIKIVQKFGKKCAAAIFPIGNSPAQPFLKQTTAELRAATALPISNAYAFAQQAVPLLLNSVGGCDFPSTLIFVGPSGNSSFDKINDNAIVALSRSLGREFGKKCLHVAHIKFTKGHDLACDSQARSIASNATSVSVHKLAAFWTTVALIWKTHVQISETAWHLHTQPLNCFSNELTI